MKKFTLLFTLLTFCFGFSQNGGDTCGTAVSANSGTIFTGTLITQDSGGSEMGTGGDSAWFIFTAPEDGILYVNSCNGGADTYLNIGTGTCGTLSSDISNDDSCASGLGNNYASEATLGVTTSTVYYIEWDDRYTSGANAFDWTLEFTPTPSCLEPTALNVENLTYTSVDLVWTDNNGAMNWDVEFLDITNGDLQTGTPTWTGASNPLSPTGLTSGNDYAYYVRANCDTDGYSTWAGPYNFSTPALPPANDTCAGVIDLGTQISPLTASTSAALNDFDQDCLTTGSPDMIYSIVIPTGSTLSIGQTSNTYDSKHRLAYGAVCPGDILIDCIDDPELNNIEWLNNTGSNQTVYWIQSAYNTASGNFTLAWSVLACTTNEATFTIVEDCANSAGFFINVEVTNTGSGTTVSITDDQASTPINTVGVGTYQFGPYVSATDVVITVTNDDSAECFLNSSTLTHVCPPANDNFADATVVVCDGNYTGSTINATLDEDDAPDGFGADLDANNVWFSYTGSGSEEDITVDLCASSYDSAVLVYTGTSGALTLVAGNDDNAAACGVGSLQSQTTFTSDGTATYYITITGYNPLSVGNYDLTITCISAVSAPANDTCATPTLLTNGGTTTGGTTTGATSNGSHVNPTCENQFAGIVDVWYTFIAPTSGNATINTVVTTASQANVAIYDDCNLTTQLGCSDANGGESVDVTGLTAGVTYFIRVWNDGLAAKNAVRTEGTFTIAVDETLSTVDFNSETLFTYFPNPVNNTLTLKAQQNIQNVAVYNMLGQEVLHTVPNNITNEINMSKLQSGAYFVKVTIGNTTETIRVIKN